ncbi:MAG: porin, partial [Sphingomonadales bacterium]
MNFLKISAGALLITVVAFPAVANDEISDPKENKLKVDWTTVPVLKSADGKFSIKLRGRAFWDNAWVNDSDNTLNLNATQFRTARIGVDGQIGSDLSFRFEADFAHKTVNYKDITIQWKGPLTVKGGHMKFAVPMENSSSGRFVPLMEQGGFNNAFGFGRQFGISSPDLHDYDFFMARVKFDDKSANDPWNVQPAG